MNKDTKYKVVIGMSIVKEGTPAFADYGLTYRNMSGADMVGMQAMIGGNFGEFAEVLEPIVRRLIRAGIMQIEGTDPDGAAVLKAMMERTAAAEGGGRRK